jgi:transposase-like protein
LRAQIIYSSKNLFIHHFGSGRRNPYHMHSDNKKQHARHLYLVAGKTQKEIAIEVGVSERTVYSWIHQYAWHKLRQASYQAPATVADNLYSQLVEMQNAIAAREHGKRYPTPQEAETMRKLILSIEAMKKTTSLSQNMQMMESFRDYVRPLNAQFTKQLAHYSNRYLAAKGRNGYAPYQMEYGIDMQAAVAPFYDELDGTQPCDLDDPPAYPAPCSEIGACGKETGCNWPRCRSYDETHDDPKDPVVEDTPWQPLGAPQAAIPEDPQPTLPNRKNIAVTLDSKGIEPLPIPLANRKIPEENPQFLQLKDKVNDQTSSPATQSRLH